jgi:hypothetical protein
MKDMLFALVVMIIIAGLLLAAFYLLEMSD